MKSDYTIVIKGKRATIRRSGLETDIDGWWASKGHFEGVGMTALHCTAMYRASKHMRDYRQLENVYKLDDSKSQVTPQLSSSFPLSLRLTVDASSGACDPRFKEARFLPLRRTISFSHAFSRRRSLASRSRSSVRPVKSATARSRLDVLSFFLTLNRAVGALSS